MSSMRKVMIFSGLIMVIAVAVWLIPAVIEAHQNAAYLSGFEKIHEAKTPFTAAQVEDVMGQPAHIEQSESVDQTINGTVYHYPANGQDLKVVFINGVVFRTEFVPTTKT